MELRRSVVRSHLIVLLSGQRMLTLRHWIWLNSESIMLILVQIAAIWRHILMVAMRSFRSGATDGNTGAAKEKYCIYILRIVCLTIEYEGDAEQPNARGWRCKGVNRRREPGEHYNLAGCDAIF